MEYELVEPKQNRRITQMSPELVHVLELLVPSLTGFKHVHDEVRTFLHSPMINIGQEPLKYGLVAALYSAERSQ